MSIEAANAFFGLVTAAAAVVTAGAAITAVRIAKKQAEAWRHQQVFQRQAQCAEELLVSAPQVVEALRAARWPLALAGERVDLLALRDGETRTVADPFAMVSHRLLNQADIISRFEATAFKAKVLIGPETWQRSAALVLMWFSIIRTAQMLSMRHIETDLSDDRSDDRLLVHSHRSESEDTFELDTRKVLAELESDPVRFFAISASEE